MMVINSKEYWDSRFENDWESYDGNKQTQFFAKLLCELLPEWLIEEINANAYSICDIGCAEGDSLECLSKVFYRSQISGEDFSDKAIAKAGLKHPEFEFYVSDITKPEGKDRYDVVIASNVVEHFKHTYNTIRNLGARSNKYTVVMIPYREDISITDEHEVIFHTNNIPVFVENLNLLYAKSVVCNSIYYPGEQIVLVYGNKRNALLSSYTEYIESDAFSELKNEKNIIETEQQVLVQEHKKLIQEQQVLVQEHKRLIQEQQMLISDKNLLENQNTDLTLNVAELTKQLDDKNNQIDLLINSISNLQEKNKDIICENNILLKRVEESDKCVDNYKKENHLISLQLENMEAENKAKLDQLESVMDANTELNNRIQKAIDIRNDIINRCITIEHSKSFKIIHLFRRVYNQLIKGSFKEKKLFFKWLYGKFAKWPPSSDMRYNPLDSIISLTGEIGVKTYGIVNREIKEENEDTTTLLSDLQKEALHGNYSKYDVIILSIISYDFRFQRPQHFAERFAKNGHRVFYINADFFAQNSVEKRDENLYLINFHNDDSVSIHLTDWSDKLDALYKLFDELMYQYCVRDAVVVVDYPNWIFGADYLRSQYGFKIVTDYMDDYTGFLNPAEKLVAKNCKRLLSISDKIIPSSDFLHNIASKYAKDCSIVRNGTEYEHFHLALSYQKPHDRKIIGYYGAVAHWFDYKKVCYVAKKFSECDIVIIGNVSDWKKELEREHNIILLGEHPYKELPRLFADFDVCLIPFDTSTDLIKATNPVKFYEYLSAGKKIVATEIPELMPYRDKYVYMSNDNERFCEYIQLCLDDNDELVPFEEKIAFAKKNDWQERFDSFQGICKSAYKKVSVIVLSYNNIGYTKGCIESILRETAYPNYEIIVVDNNSQDESVNWLRELDDKHIPNVRVVLNSENRGFAGANNQGIELATGDYIVLLNNDTIVSRGWMIGMLKHLEKSDKLGMIGLTTNSIGNECMIRVEYHSFDEFIQFAYIKTNEMMNIINCDVEMLPLFCTMIKRSVIEEVGALDDGYQIGMFEDDDYTMAVKAAGYHIAIAEDAFVHHYDGGSFRRLPTDEYMRIFTKNRQKFENKWNVKWKQQKLREGLHREVNKEMII